MITIILKSRVGEGPVSGQRLSLEFSKPRIGWTKPKNTDASGIACFQVQPGIGTLFINGGRYLTGWLSEELTVFIDLPEPAAEQTTLRAEASEQDTSALNVEL